MLGYEGMSGYEGMPEYEDMSGYDGIPIYIYIRVCVRERENDLYSTLCIHLEPLSKIRATSEYSILPRKALLDSSSSTACHVLTHPFSFKSAYTHVLPNGSPEVTTSVS